VTKRREEPKSPASQLSEGDGFADNRGGIINGVVDHRGRVALQGHVSRGNSARVLAPVGDYSRTFLVASDSLFLLLSRLTSKKDRHGYE
jgi:hypothetical protein